MNVRLVSNAEYNESPSIDRKVATGRATCRFCGCKIPKGEEDVVFYPVFNGGCNWERVIAHAHLGCVRERCLPEKR